MDAGSKRDPYPINPNDPKGRKLLDEHKNHYHIGM